MSTKSIWTLCRTAVTDHSLDGGSSYESAVKHYEAAIKGSKKMQGVASDWAVTYNNLGHAYRRLE